MNSARYQAALILTGLCLSAGGALAADPAPKTAAPSQARNKPGGTDVLDFDADIIEGQKKAPELFLQTEVQKLSLDAVLYQRKDFNSFHTVDASRRPRLAEPVKEGGAKK
jgi:hypothetical protein